MQFKRCALFALVPLAIASNANRTNQHQSRDFPGIDPTGVLSTVEAVQKAVTDGVAMLNGLVGTVKGGIATVNVVKGAVTNGVAIVTQVQGAVTNGVEIVTQVQVAVKGGIEVLNGVSTIAKDCLPMIEAIQKAAVEAIPLIRNTNSIADQYGAKIYKVVLENQASIFAIAGCLGKSDCQGITPPPTSTSKRTRALAQE